jgi:hypothetical protein
MTKEDLIALDEKIKESEGGKRPLVLCEKCFGKDNGLNARVSTMKCDNCNEPVQRFYLVRVTHRKEVLA